MDCAFYLLNVDAIQQSVATYKEALKIRYALLGQRSLPVAIALEDLAYALYVHNYSSGQFMSALTHVERAIGILSCVVPATHLFLASAKRVKALVLEEIALEEVSLLERVGENDRRAAHHRLLLESEELHQSALRLSLDAFGEVNVQTAKHYGNLGRLYQSMTKYEVSAGVGGLCEQHQVGWSRNSSEFLLQSQGSHASCIWYISYMFVFCW